MLYKSAMQQKINQGSKAGNQKLKTKNQKFAKSMSQQKPKISTSFSYETLEETLDIKPKGAKLQIGIPKEIAFQENRIALTPDAVSVLVSNGHEVTIEHNAGEAAHFRDKDYSEAGARIVYERAEVFKAPILVKSAPVIDEDIPLLQLNQVIFAATGNLAQFIQFIIDTGGNKAAFINSNRGIFIDLLNDLLEDLVIDVREILVKFNKTDVVIVLLEETNDISLCSSLNEMLIVS